MDPLSLAGQSDPASMLAAELPERPVWQAEPGVIHIVGYEACRTALVDYERFSADASRYGPAGLGGSSAPPRTMNAADPPEHGVIRSVVSDAFTHRAVAAHGPRLAALAEGLLDPLVDQGPFDVVQDFAAPYVQAALASVLGLSPGREEDLQRWSDELSAPTSRHGVELARRQLGELFGELVDRPDDLPPGSLLSTLCAALDTGELSREQVLATCVLLVQAGAETTRNLLASTVLTLIEQPELLDALRGERRERHAVVEEALRYHSSVAAAVRYTTADTELAGVPVSGRCPVFVWLGAANRDPAVVEHPERFDIGHPRHHLALGAGPHLCLGAHLARAEVGAALAALAERVDSVALVGPVTWLPSPLARGPRGAEIRCEPRGRGQRG